MAFAAFNVMQTGSVRFRSIPTTASTAFDCAVPRPVISVVGYIDTVCRVYPQLRWRLQRSTFHQAGGAMPLSPLYSFMDDCLSTAKLLLLR
jgi:hypothetical protein